MGQSVTRLPDVLYQEPRDNWYRWTDSERRDRVRNPALFYV
jgi:hypothetical protein